MREKLTGYRAARSPPSLDPPPVFAGRARDLARPRRAGAEHLDQYDREPERLPAALDGPEPTPETAAIDDPEPTGTRPRKVGLVQVGADGADVPTLSLARAIRQCPFPLWNCTICTKSGPNCQISAEFG